MRTCAKCNHDCHEDAVSLRAALAAKDAEIERLKKDADAGLGRAVRAMPEGAGLYHMQPEVSGDGWCAKERDFANRGTTPEAALRAAGLMKGEGE